MDKTDFLANAKVVNRSEEFWQNSNFTRTKSPISESDTRWIAWNKKLERPFSFDGVDTIQLSPDEFEQLSQITIGSIHESIRKPALSEFTLKFSRAKKRVSICFRNTVLPQEGIIHESNNGGKITYPLVDAYFSLDDGKTINQIVNIGYCFVDDGEIAAAHWLIWAKNREAHSHHIALTMNNAVGTLYWLVQKLLRDRPTIFVTTTTRRVTSPNGKRKKTRQRSKVKTTRVIRTNLEELHAYCEQDREKRKITCPAWGVIGHWRTYKSGKTVWIKPHIKGKQRHNPSAYNAKDYELVNEIK